MHRYRLNEKKSYHVYLNKTPDTMATQVLKDSLRGCLKFHEKRNRSGNFGCYTVHWVDYRF